MRILVATTAGAGHFGPLVPFARACRDAGHDVRVAAPASFTGAVEQAGFVPAPFADVDPKAMGAVFGRLPALTMQEADAVVVREVFGRLDAQAALPGVRETVTTWRPDVVLRDPAELASYAVAEEHGLPHVQVGFGLDRLSDVFVPLLTEPLRELGCETAGLLAAPRWTLVPPSFDLPAAVAPGPPRRFRELPDADGGDRPMPRWWGDRTDPLVYVTFGSVAAGLPLFPGFYRAVVEALSDVPARVLMTLGEAGDPVALDPLPENLHVERWWPQRDVMPHVAAVVGHGGFGTTLLALAAGVPQVVVPLFSFDQFENADRVAAVGAGVTLQDDGAAGRLAGAVFQHGPAAVDDLADAVGSVLTDSRMRQVARDLATEIAALPPATECVAVLEELASPAR